MFTVLISLLFLSFQVLLADPQVPVPTGIQLPKELLGQVIPTANPYIPNRPENIPPSPPATPTSTSKNGHTFYVSEFLIVIGAVLGLLGLIVGILLVVRCVKGERDIAKKWEQEQEALARRTTEGIEKHKRGWFKKNKPVTAEEKEKEETKLAFESD
jgi:hypothetical protein